MSSLNRLAAAIAIFLVVGCVTNTRIGGKPLKEEPQGIPGRQVQRAAGHRLPAAGQLRARQGQTRTRPQAEPEGSRRAHQPRLLYDRTGEAKDADKHSAKRCAWRPTSPTSPTTTPSTCARTAASTKAWRVSSRWRSTSITVRRKWRSPTPASACAAPSGWTRPSRSSSAPSGPALTTVEATVQLASLHLERNRLPEARKVVDVYLKCLHPQPDVLLTAVTVARASKDKMSEEKYSRTLRLEFRTLRRRVH